jgi:opacity protein-like surface antigen
MIPSFSSFPGAALRGLLFFGLASIGFKGCVCSAGAQEVSDSLAGEKAAEAAKKQETAPDYNLHWGPVSFQFDSALHVEFTDNVINSGVNRSSDEIIRPEVELRSYWPITDLNALTLSLGVGYEYYVKNTGLNVDSPLISPDSEVALVLYVKNLRFRFHEAFSYQESLYYGASYSQQSGQFINLHNLGTFGRIDNVAGLTADWDLGAFVLSLSYDHENFISMLSTLDYLTRASDLFSSTIDVAVGPQFHSGVEAKASWNDYQTDQLTDNWRARVGPFVEVSPGEYVKLRAGGGYDGVFIPPNAAGLATDSTPYYAYARATHTVNDWLAYSLSVAHENQLGWNTANMEATYVGLSTSLKCINRLELTPAFYYGLGKESGPNYAGNLFHENYNFFQVSLGLAYRLGERWTTDLRYDYMQKDSDLNLAGYYRNRFTAGVTYRF